MKKQFILIFAFVFIPLIYVFLRLFGEDVWELKTYLQVPAEPQIETDCIPPSFPYTVAPRPWTLAGGETESFPNSQINLIMYLNETGWREQMNQLNGIMESYEGKTELSTLVFAGASDSAQAAIWRQRLESFAINLQGWSLCTGPAATIDFYYSCTLFKAYSDRKLKDAKPETPANELLVMLDRENRIRGYFDTEERSEFDRLKDEIAILLKVYKQESDGSDGR